MKKIFTLLLTSTSLFAADPTSYETNYTRSGFTSNHCRPQTSERDFYYIKPMHAYLHNTWPAQLEIPSETDKAQVEYVNNFILFYNSIIREQAANYYCGLYGQKDYRGAYLNSVSKSYKTSRLIADLIAKFVANNPIKNRGFGLIQDSYLLSIYPDADYTFERN